VYLCRHSVIASAHITINRLDESGLIIAPKYQPLEVNECIIKFIAYNAIVAVQFTKKCSICDFYKR